MHSGKLIALALVIGVVAVSPAAAATSSTPGWQRALEIRSDALNQRYHLGRYAIPATLTTEDWKRALELRSDALNQRYHLGRYALPGVREDSARGWSWAITASIVVAGLCLVAGAFVLTARGRMKPRATRLS